MITPDPNDQRPLWRIFLAFLVPMVVANILQSLSGTINNIFVGQMLGTQALAAVSGMFPLLFFCISLVIGIGAGAGVLIGQAWGARELHKVKEIAGTSLMLGLLIGLAVAVFGGTLTEHLLVALGTPPDVLPIAIGYARTMMLAMPGLLVFLLLTQLMRGVGDTMTPLFALILSTAVSCLLTPAFIRGWFGLPQLGVTSAAVASIMASASCTTELSWYEPQAACLTLSKPTTLTSSGMRRPSSMRSVSMTAIAMWSLATNTASGHRRSARRAGIAERMPKVRAS